MEGKPRIKIVPTATGRRYHVLGVRGNLVADAATPLEADANARSYVAGLEEGARLVDEAARMVIDALSDARAAARELVMIGNPEPRRPMPVESAEPENGSALEPHHGPDVGPTLPRRIPDARTAEERIMQARTKKLGA